MSARATAPRTRRMPAGRRGQDSADRPSQLAAGTGCRSAWRAQLQAASVLALSRCTLLAAAPWAAPAVTFGVPSLVGSSNSSQPDGSDFWFPSITIPTGIRGHVAQVSHFRLPLHPPHHAHACVCDNEINCDRRFEPDAARPIDFAQHITLSGDGGTCPPPSHPNQSCEQTMLSTDGGLTYKVTKQIQTGTSGNFNGYGDLGSWVPPKKGSKSTPGEFQAIVGCNDCFFGIGGGSLTRPTYLQTWLDDGTTLKLTGNTSIAYKGTPAAFTGDRLQGRACGAPPGKPCGMSTPDQSIIRTKDGGLLMAMYGHAADGYMNGSLCESPRLPALHPHPAPRVCVCDSHCDSGCGRSSLTLHAPVLHHCRHDGVLLVHRRPGLELRLAHGCDRRHAGGQGGWRGPVRAVDGDSGRWPCPCRVPARGRTPSLALMEQ